MTSLMNITNQPNHLNVIQKQKKHKRQFLEKKLENY